MWVMIRRDAPGMQDSGAIAGANGILAITRDLTRRADLSIAVAAYRPFNLARRAMGPCAS
jgi:hypothetical protein